MAREMMIVLVMMMGIGMIEHDEFATSVRTTRWADMPGPSRRSQTKRETRIFVVTWNPPGHTSHRASPSPTRKLLTFLKWTAFEFFTLYAPGLLYIVDSRDARQWRWRWICGSW